METTAAILVLSLMAFVGYRLYGSLKMSRACAETAEHISLSKKVGSYLLAGVIALIGAVKLFAYFSRGEEAPSLLLHLHIAAGILLLSIVAAMRFMPQSICRRGMHARMMHIASFTFIAIALSGTYMLLVKWWT